MACVGNDDDLRAITIGTDGAFAAMKAGAIFVDHTTAQPKSHVNWILKQPSAASVYRCAGVRRSGGGGKRCFDRDVWRQRRRLCSRRAGNCGLCQNVQAIRSRGSGQLTKMVNQICIAGLVEALAEGIHFAKKAGLDVNAVVETISNGAAQSWQMDNRHKTMNEGKFDFGFAVEWMRKDLSICLADRGAMAPAFRSQPLPMPSIRRSK